MPFRNLKKRRRIQVVLIASISLAGSTALIGYGMRDGINFFRSPSQVIAEPPVASEVFRIGGLVEEGTLVRGEGSSITFVVTDGGGSVPVSYTGILPDLFAEAQGMVGTGRYIDGVFVATEILARHDETYMPREVIEALEEQGVYRPGTKLILQKNPTNHRLIEPQINVRFAKAAMQRGSSIRTSGKGRQRSSQTRLCSFAVSASCAFRPF